MIGDQAVEIAVAVHVADRDIPADRAFVETLFAIGVVALAIIEPDSAGLAVIGDEGIEVAVAIEVAERDAAGKGIAQALAGVFETPVALVEPHFVGSVEFADVGVDITVAIEIRNGDAFAVSPAEHTAQRQQRTLRDGKIK